MRDTSERVWWRDKSLLALLALFIALAPLVTQRIYASDEIQYFAYTHSLFFDGDFDFSNQYLSFYQSDPVKFQNIYDDLYNKREPLTDLPLNVAPIGTGLLWLPSFGLAHLIVLAAQSLGADVAADGYSRPYIAAICLTSYLFACLGLLLCYGLSRRLFGKRVSAVGVILVWLATPLIFYSVVAPPWSHATSLLTVSLFLFYWDRTRRPEGRRFHEWACLGACAGLMMLVREQDALFLVVPGVEALYSLAARYRARATTGLLLHPRFSHWVGGLLLMSLVAAVTFIPQLIAYKAVTGNFSPSKVVTGKFTWTSPNFLNVLFSPEHGLITWTPLVALAIAGLIFLWGSDRLLALALSVALFLQVYVAGSFLTWQSAGSFGQRRFINSSAILVLGLAALLTWALANGVPRWLLGLLGAGFVAWNGGLLAQYALWCSPQRQGLDWNVVLRGQLELPVKLPSLIWDYITDRQVFYRKTLDC